MDGRNKNLNIDQSSQDPEDPEFSLLVPEKRSVLKAIKTLNFRATPPELAAASGLSVNKASFWLNKVAGETKGKLEVAADGTIYYSFAPTFTNAYLQRGLRKTLLLVGSIAFQVLYWLVRVSFGVALVLSILVVSVLIIAAIVAVCSDSGGGDSGGGGGDFSFDPGFIGDLFSWNYSPSAGYYPNSIPSERRDEYGRYIEENPKGNFFLECFSFLFGDGAPNSNLQEIRWQQIARVIKQNGGVVSTEQLAPFLDGDRSDSGMILSALAQFNGRPVVTKSGYIVYVFPDFLEESVAPVLPPMRNENYLKEDDWKFSAFPPEVWIKVLILAGLNFAGSWWLFKHIATINMLHYVAALIDVLLSYAIIFLAIPAIRLVVLMVLNQRIAKRNERRQKAFELVDKAEGDVGEELMEAKEIRMQELQTLHSDRTIIYDSDRDILDQQFDQKPISKPRQKPTASSSDGAESIKIRRKNPEQR